MESVTAALDHLRQAQQNFNNAAPEYIEVSVYQLKAAETLYGTTLREDINE